MVIRFRCFTLKLNFSHKKLYLTLGNFNFFLLVKTATNFRNLQISNLLTPIQTGFFQVLSSLCAYIRDIHRLKNIEGTSLKYRKK